MLLSYYKSCPEKSNRPRIGQRQWSSLTRTELRSPERTKSIERTEKYCSLEGCMSQRWKGDWKIIVLLFVVNAEPLPSKTILICFLYKIELAKP